VIANDIHLWDIASGIILAKESGGILKYYKKDTGKYDVVAASSTKLLKSIEEILEGFNCQERN
jgi:fructose-1,6-bisphosphatase/inositol monophosphatase family enzyme